MALKSLENRRIRVRGWVEARTGPRIELLRVGQSGSAGRELARNEPKRVGCDVTGIVRDGATRRNGRRLWAAPALLCAALALSACGDMSRFETASPSPSAAPAKPNRTVAQTPATEREHERILSSYGGAYDDPRLEALIGKTVDRLVAASDRPDQAYKVTILNSGAVNAFALPTGQLYVTRGLVALASDTSELSSVLSHEMAHVLAKHASIREDQARQAAVVTRVVTDMGNDPDLTALALAKTKLTMASFSRAAGIRG